VLNSVKPDIDVVANILDNRKKALAEQGGAPINPLAQLKE
jgi:hypothetical protein